MLVIANDWTTKMVWEHMKTLLRCPPFWDAPEPPPSQARFQPPRGLSFIYWIMPTRPSPMDGSVGCYGLTAMGLYYLEALENPEAAHGTYLLMALKHPEIESPEALAIYDAVPVWEKVLGWLSVIGVHIVLRKQWLRHKVGGLVEHLVYGVIIDVVVRITTKHDLVWLIEKLLSI
jgi:hypothetical protein